LCISVVLIYIIYLVSINNKRELSHDQDGNLLETHNHQKKAFMLLALLLTSLFLAFQVGLQNNHLIASGDMGTQVDGTINSNTTWTAADSPYIITSTIIIPENVNLTIEPGVTVTAGSSVTTMFLINGAITAHGDPTNKITFDGNSNANFFETNHPVSEGFVDLDYCIIRNGQSAFWFDNTGSFNLTNSELKDLSQESYLWYPSQDTFIEFNTFTNTSGLKIGTDDYSSDSSGVVYVEYNLFINNQGYIIDNFASYGLSKAYVNYNSFNDTSGIILEVEKTSTTADMDASQNYWGTNDTSVIDSLIYDKNDDPSCSSYINYLPLLDAPDPEVPIAPTPTPSPTPTTTNTPEPTPNNSPDPSAIPNPSTSDTTPTATPTTSSNSPTSDPSNPSLNTTSNPSSASYQGPNPSAAPAIPEFSLLTIMLILIIAGLTIGITLRKKIVKFSQ
jgi:hypothetical protein